MKKTVLAGLVLSRNRRHPQAGLSSYNPARPLIPIRAARCLEGGSAPEALVFDSLAPYSSLALSWEARQPPKA